MKYNFKSNNINTSFHAFGQIEGQYEKYVEGLSILNILCDYYDKETAREMTKQIEYADEDRYVSIIQDMYNNLEKEDIICNGNNYYYLEDLDMFFEVEIYDTKCHIMTVTTAGMETYVTEIRKG